jgi:hypothetical protein
MRRRFLYLLALAAAAASAARAQFGVPSPGGAGLAQFQPGIAPRSSNFDLEPGQSVRLAMYCADLFASTPTDRVPFTAPGSDAGVMLASSQELTLGDAITGGLVQVRGRGPADPPRREGGQWFDVALTNAAPQPLQVSMPSGTLLVPAGQSVPDVRPSVRRLFAAARARGWLGSTTLAHAVWATRGFTREDVEQTTMTRLSDAEAANVKTLLAASDLGYEFDRGRGDYARLYNQKRAELGEKAALATGTAVLPSGKNAPAELLVDAAGHALVTLASAKGGEPFHYAGRVTSRRSDRLLIQLIHLKTGRPLEATRGPVLIKLAG